MQPNPRYTTILTRTVKRTYKRSPPPPPENSGLAPPLLSTQAVKWSGRLCLARKTGPSYVTVTTRLDIFPTPLGQSNLRQKKRSNKYVTLNSPCLAFNSHPVLGECVTSWFSQSGINRHPRLLWLHHLPGLTSHAPAIGQGSQDVDPVFSVLEPCQTHWLLCTCLGIHGCTRAVLCLQVPWGNLIRTIYSPDSKPSEERLDPLSPLVMLCVWDLYARTKDVSSKGCK